jgi:hypothetical protein
LKADAEDHFISVVVTGEFLNERPDRGGKIITFDSGGAQPLHGIATFIDSSNRAIDRATQVMLGLRGTRRQKFVRHLKAQHQSLKALQQSVMQVPRDARPLADPLFKAHVVLSGQPPQPKLIQARKCRQKED